MHIYLYIQEVHYWTFSSKSYHYLLSFGMKISIEWPNQPWSLTFSNFFPSQISNNLDSSSQSINTSCWDSTNRLSFITSGSLWPTIQKRFFLEKLRQSSFSLQLVQADGGQTPPTCLLNKNESCCNWIAMLSDKLSVSWEASELHRQCVKMHLSQMHIWPFHSCLSQFYQISSKCGFSHHLVLLEHDHSGVLSLYFTI